MSEPGNVDERERNKAVVRRFVEEVQNDKSEEAYWELNDPELVKLSSPASRRPRRPRGWVHLSLRVHERVPGQPGHDRRHDRRGRSGGDEEDRFTGTHTADFAGIPATGNRVTLQFVDIMRVRDGKIVEHWNCIDQLSFMQQLGVIPQP